MYMFSTEIKVAVATIRLLRRMRVTTHNINIMKQHEKAKMRNNMWIDERELKKKATAKRKVCYTAGESRVQGLREGQMES
jgi:hypothetical protein